MKMGADQAARLYEGLADFKELRNVLQKVSDILVVFVLFHNKKSRQNNKTKYEIRCCSFTKTIFISVITYILVKSTLLLTLLLALSKTHVKHPCCKKEKCIDYVLK